MAVILSPHHLISLITAEPQVLKSPWGDLNAHHHRAQRLIFTWVEKRTKYTPKREGCFKSAAGNGMIWSKRRQCSVSAECMGQRAFWCGSVLCELIHTAVVSKTLIHLMPFFPLLLTVLAPRTWRIIPQSLSLAQGIDIYSTESRTGDTETILVRYYSLGLDV